MQIYTSQALLNKCKYNFTFHSISDWETTTRVFFSCCFSKIQYFRRRPDKITPNNIFETLSIRESLGIHVHRTIMVNRKRAESKTCFMISSDVREKKFSFTAILRLGAYIFLISFESACSFGFVALSWP